MGRKAASVLPEAVASEMKTSLPPLRMTGKANSAVAGRSVKAPEGKGKRLGDGQGDGPLQAIKALFLPEEFHDVRKVRSAHETDQGGAQRRGDVLEFQAVPVDIGFESIVDWLASEVGNVTEHADQSGEIFLGLRREIFGNGLFIIFKIGCLLQHGGEVRGQLDKSLGAVADGVDLFLGRG